MYWILLAFLCLRFQQNTKTETDIKLYGIFSGSPKTNLKKVSFKLTMIYTKMVVKKNLMQILVFKRRASNKNRCKIICIY